jgi:hypothetical protein
MQHDNGPAQRAGDVHRSAIARDDQIALRQQRLQVRQRGLAAEVEQRSPSHPLDIARERSLIWRARQHHERPQLIAQHPRQRRPVSRGPALRLPVARTRVQRDRRTSRPQPLARLRQRGPHASARFWRGAQAWNLIPRLYDAASRRRQPQHVARLMLVG